MFSTCRGASFHWTVIFVAIVLLKINISTSQPASEWNKMARDSLKRALDLEKLNKNVAKNVIFFIGDGMGVTTVTAARILKGQNQGLLGEEAELSFETFPHLALIKTYNTDQQVSDSAGTATAFLCGVKSKAGTLGVDDRVEKGNCHSIKHAKVHSFIELAADEGRAAGIISTARITHATPAAVYAKVPERAWERDTMVPGHEKAAGCSDIASQLIDNAQRYQVVLGGGRRELMPTAHVDPEYYHERGHRTDGRDLINEWFHSFPDDTANMYVVNREQLLSVDVEKTDNLLGLFEPSHMLFDVEKDELGAGDPSLAEMVGKAIEMLRKREKGFVLFVEAGRIDHAHHKGRAYMALAETLALDEAVAKAVKMTDGEETLIVVTSDHSHTNTMGGYPSRGNPILGRNDKEHALDGLPYTTLGYANGPGGEDLRQSYLHSGRRPNIDGVDTASRDYRPQAAIPLLDESHGGEDVAVYATGPMSHLFHGVKEQHYIAHAVKYAACIGQYADSEHCANRKTTVAPPTTTTAPPTTTKKKVKAKKPHAHKGIDTKQLDIGTQSPHPVIGTTPEIIDHELSKRLDEQDDDGHSGRIMSYIPSKIEISCIMASSANSESSALQSSIIQMIAFLIFIFTACI
ncbi:alkaline phosphatase, tissue-nonspecific isozyme-like [Ptychodera flava]|uniref:alkaline phosphatase, tissue-nonspecific isozyme-like n=1 Tax=Ptychodera flava TaxID=63121 RepID=UPI003969F40B